MGKSLKNKFKVICIGLVLGLLVALCFHTDLSLDEKSTRAQDIFLNLQQYTDSGTMFNTLIVVEDEQINAWTDGDSVYITTGMLNFTKSSDEIAFVLGHELGHIVLGHFLCSEEFISTINERNADKYGAYLAIRAGYNVCAGKDIWKRMVDQYGAGEGASDGIHPPNIDRENSLDFPECQDVWR